MDPHSGSRSISSTPHSVRTLSSSRSSTSLSTSSKQLTPPRNLTRRASSLDFRSAAASPAPDMHSRRPPSAPMIRKRSSLASLTQNDGPSTPQPSIRRRSSLLSIRDSPPEHFASPPPPRDLTPPSQDPYAETSVILTDTSYKHRYARPKTSLADLASIVERPERIPAAVLGICAAQVLAGKERISINKTTRMGKLSDPEVMLVHAHTPLPKTGSKKSWPEELTTICGTADEKLKRGLAEVPNTYHQGDLYLCGESLEDLEGCVGALYDGADAVFGPGPVRKAFVCIRPPGTCLHV